MLGSNTINASANSAAPAPNISRVARKTNSPSRKLNNAADIRARKMMRSAMLMPPLR